MNAKPKEKQFDTYITVRIAEETRAALAKRAADERRTLSNYLRIVLEDHVKDKPVGQAASVCQ